MKTPPKQYYVAIILLRGCFFGEKNQFQLQVHSAGTGRVDNNCAAAAVYRGVYRKQALRGHKRPCVYKRGAQLHRGGRGGGERRQRVARGEACVRAALRRVHNYTASHVGLHHRGRGAIFGWSNEHRELHYCRLRFGQHVGRAWEEEEKEHGQRGAALTISCVQKRENIKM